MCVLNMELYAFARQVDACHVLLEELDAELHRASKAFHEVGVGCAIYRLCHGG